MSEEKRVVALGFFDGVHLGHAALLKRTRELAAQLDVRPALLTFDSHPDQIVSGMAVSLINSPADRRYIADNFFNISDIITIPFDEKTMHMPWADFVRLVIEKFGAVHFVVGDDFRFGYRGEGTAEKLKALGAELGFGCDILPRVRLGDVIVSSTYIRSLVADGNMSEARRFLGHPHLVTGEVRHGFRLGRKLGAPTINMRIEDGVIVPRHGVYAAKLRLLGESEYYTAVTNIGVRPTVSGENAVSVESFLLDFDRDVYGMEAVCEFYRFMRPEMKFPSVEALSERIHKDAEDVRAYFEKNGTV